MEKILKLFSLIAIAIISATTVGCIDLNRPHHQQDEEVIVEEYVEEQVTPHQAAENMLNVRESILWDYACDSVFRVMPEKIIVYITLNNPEFGVWDVGNEYLLKKEIYEKLNEDVKLLYKFKEQQNNHNGPDTIPEKPEPNTKTKLADTIPTI